MSQRLVFEIIKSFKNGAQKSRLIERAEEKYPDRTLSAYFGDRLSTLIEKGAILQRSQNGETIYKVNPDYSVDDITVLLEDIDREVDRNQLESNGIEVANIVGNQMFCEKIDLQDLAIKFTNVEYEPETSPMAIWRPFEKNAVTVLIPSTGRMTIVGSKTKDEIYRAIDKIYDELIGFAEEVVSKRKFINEFQINNIAAAGSLDRELELSHIATDLGFEETEYEPERFPGVVYRPDHNAVILIFRSGRVVITSNSYLGVLNGWFTVCEDLDTIGVEIEYQK